MKTSKIFITALATAAVLTALPASAQSTRLRCLDVKNISDTSSRDGGETLTFKLRDGRTVVNRLMQKCDGLRFGGFVWQTSPGGEVCESAQTLRVLVTGEICRLGKFDAPVKSASR